MKIKTVLVAGLAGGIGYVLGTKAGPSRYEEIKAKADQLAKSPQVQETVANLAEGVKKNAAKLPDPVADVVTSVADLATGSGSTEDVAAAAQGAAESAADAAGDAAADLKDKAGDAADSAKDSTTSADADLTAPGLADTDLADADELDLATLEELTSPDAPPRLDETSTLGDNDPFVEPSTSTDPFDSPDAPPRY